MAGTTITIREAQVLHWVIQGKRDAEIAAILGISVRTIHKHVQRLLKKLQVETRTAAALRATELGLAPKPVPDPLRGDPSHLPPPLGRRPAY